MSRGAQQFTLTIDEKELSHMNWHGYAVQTGLAKSPFFFNQIEERRQKNKSNILIITGPPGEGKTYFALRLAEIFDEKFDPVEQIVFSRPHLLRLIGENTPLKRGQVILIDEAHYGMGTRRWMEDVQKDLMDAIASVRSQGFIILIVSLHIEMLDKIVRQYVLSFMVHMEDRGVGIAYRLYTPRFAKDLFKERLGRVRLNLPHAELCNHADCLRCRWLYRGCMTDRAIYERRKRQFIDEENKRAEQKAEERELQAKLPTIKEIVTRLYNEKNKEYTRYGNLKLEWIQLAVERIYHITIGRDKARSISNQYTLVYGKHTTTTEDSS